MSVRLWNFKGGGQKINIYKGNYHISWICTRNVSLSKSAKIVLNLLFQKSTDNFSFKNINLGVYFFVKIIFVNFVQFLTNSHFLFTKYNVDFGKKILLLRTHRLRNVRIHLLLTWKNKWFNCKIRFCCAHLLWQRQWS